MNAMDSRTSSMRARANDEWEKIMSLPLDPAEFSNLSLDQRIARCREMAAEAERFAATADSHMRDKYLDLAAKWLELGNEMESIAKS